LTDFRHTRSLRADIRRLAGTMPAGDLARRLGCSPGSLRTIASEMKVSLRAPPRDDDAGRPGTDDRAVARIDAGRARLVEIKTLVGADVATKLTVAATERGKSIGGLLAEVATILATEGLVGAVLGDR
jgi:hypothetical protein